jgi:5'-nucleotidase
MQDEQGSDMVSGIRKSRPTRALVASAVVLTATITGVALSTPASTASTARTQGSGSPSTPPLSGLKILLTDDDSMQATAAVANGAYDGGGLYTLRHALCGAGADVVVVAPWGQQSGAGTGFTSSGSLTLTPPAALPSQSGLYDATDCADAPSHGSVVGVCASASTCVPGTPSATPTDTVRLALRSNAGLPSGWRPDLVLSGINFGQNIGGVTNSSGTVSAAVAALANNVPSVAVSAEISFACAATGINGFSCMNPVYAKAAKFTVNMLSMLRSNNALQPSRRLGLNINYPFVGTGTDGTGTPKGVAVTSIGTGDPLGIGYINSSGSTYTVAAGPCSSATPCLTETRKNADTSAIAADKVSVTPIDGDWTAAPPAFGLNILVASHGKSLLAGL